MGGRIPVKHWYFDDRARAEKPVRIFAYEEVEALRSRALREECNYYGETDTFLYRALTERPISGMDVAVIGSETPWYEAICLAFGARSCTTIEYRPLVSEHPGVQCIPWSSVAKRQWDAVLAISSIEHDGLGRYGDPIDPHGDLRAMKHIRSILKPGGFMFVAVPVGEDALVWNAHRIYGRIRLPMLLSGWMLAGYYGKEGFYCGDSVHEFYQPVFVLCNEESTA